MKKQSWQLQPSDFVPYEGLKAYKGRLNQYKWNWDCRKFAFEDKTGSIHNNDFYQDTEMERIDDRLLLLKIWNFGIVTPLLVGSLAFLIDKVGHFGILEKICK